MDEIVWKNREEANIKMYLKKKRRGDGLDLPGSGLI
jgi:hypothetical protein